MANRPTLINLPPPPSDPATPSEAPGTPNSTTTSMSELSTVAIKDGHRGHFPHHHQPADAERADRISRLAGLERLVATRTPSNLGPSSGTGTANNPPPATAYFDANNQPQMFRERSTVGSASATGSVGGRTTWASESDVYDPDRMSEEQETSSIGGFSDEAASLVGASEAGSATPARQQQQQQQSQSPAVGKASAVPSYLREQQAQGQGQAQGSPSSLGTTTTSTTTTNSSVEQQKYEARMLDGLTYDESFVDTADRTPPLTGPGPGGDKTAEEVIREKLRQRKWAGEEGSELQGSMDVDREN
ncbi:uncharacterized protein EI97DRAFT_431562 [Westerdykella ornata]|uniref:Uncharacterized protein n=1 Tax=Westerdykella ornata TaxID=318751 RepID=A0A6A6JRG7_WESOR|nr:uncharacterized protein EI97DRAFT_431562 [Westerdykella ornata]KAF2278316.1 hypothetical protein EI97DRAFT_431562 [Westerdykella ornata]